MLGELEKNVLPEMGSSCQSQTDQQNGIVKEKYIPETFTFGDIRQQETKRILYLGFAISNNGKYHSITHNRSMKPLKCLTWF